MPGGAIAYIAGDHRLTDNHGRARGRGNGAVISDARADGHVTHVDADTRGCNGAVIDDRAADALGRNSRSRALYLDAGAAGTCGIKRSAGSVGDRAVELRLIHQDAKAVGVDRALIDDAAIDGWVKDRPKEADAG